MKNISLDPLIELSADLGADIRLVQGAGGNVSLKDGNDFWIKASGAWLADARQRSIFVRLDLDAVRAELAKSSDDFSACIRDHCGLRPSIETSLHAVMAQPVVAHIHSINAISWGVRHDGKMHVTEKLAGLRWAWMDYVRPGLPLTKAVQAVMVAQPDCSILLLANHGLVIAGETADEVRGLLKEVERRLEAPSSLTENNADLAGLHELRPETSRLPANSSVHCLALDSRAATLTRGALYPDHAVFLGTSLPIVVDNDTPGLELILSESPYCAIIPGMGVVLGPSFSAGAEAMLECLALLAPTLPPRDELRFLNEADIRDLLGWDAEKFRRQTMVG